MAASTTTTTTASDRSSTSGNTRTNRQQVSRDEIQSVLAKAVELRALHAALMQPNTPINLSSSASPASHSPQLSAHDYPVFAPTYDEEPLPAYHQTIGLRSRPISGNWDSYGVDAASYNDQVALWEYQNEDTYSQTGLHSGFCDLKSSHVRPGDCQKSVVGSYGNRSIVAIRSPTAEYGAKSSRRSSLEDMNSVASCNKWKPAVNSAEADDRMKLDQKNHEADEGVPFTDSNLSYGSQAKSRGMKLSWLFQRFKKKQHQNKYTGENSISDSPHRVIASEPASHIGSELGMVSVERLKKKLMEAIESRDSALTEVSEMRSSLTELRQNLQSVESHCEELKRALQRSGQGKDFRVRNQPPSFPILGSNADRVMPVSEDVMIEGFLQAASDARSSAKELCKNLLIEIDETDHALVDSLNTLLQPYKLSLASKYSKFLLHHLEAIVNQTLYQDFENCSFQNNGTPKLLHPQQQREAQFSSYLALQNLSWNDVLSKGTKYYSPEFSKFCDQKMSSIISLLNWTRPWPEQLLQAFFLTCKSLWLLHLLAFSFSPPLGILRVEENRSFDAQYMDDMLMDRVKGKGASRVKVMVMPGFYVRDRVLRCKVICRYKPGHFI
uniref:IRK-interacting protein n=1 Tax=Kalanchoe fedtschenkoi TaxID=63787 RepID=A0A7N0TIJ3_KALFE